MRGSVPFTTSLIVFVSATGLLACEHAEFSLPSSHARSTPRAPRAVAVDPAKVPSSAVFVLADLGPERRALVPFACWDHGHRSLAEGQACGALVPPQATLRCVGGDPIRLGSKTPTACGDGYEVPASAASGCDVAVWVASGPSPDVILLPSIEPQTTPVERAALAKVAPAPLEIAQAITIDLDGDDAKDRVYVARGAVVGAFGRAPEQLLSLHGAPEGRYRVRAVTDLDRDALPEIWITMSLASGSGREEHLERIAPDGHVLAIATHRCREEPPPVAEPAP
ncbi:MAG: hypothetical protein JWM74_1900 [Myxococcaceae bacterium]|nr:hypothetical protein [Myxococcaceae bacterium]